VTGDCHARNLWEPGGETPPAPQSAKRAMPTKEQARQALQAAERKDPELFMFLRLEATTGLRPGEVCALWWQDVDLEAAEVLVGYNVVHAKVWVPKTHLRTWTCGFAYVAEVRDDRLSWRCDCST
jgi:integrase